MNHSISLEKAIEMTTRYRQNKESILTDQERGKNILARSETFDKAVFETLVKNEECKFIRIYYGMDTDKKVHAIIVGADAENKDMLPPKMESKSMMAMSLEDPENTPEIFEEARRCPNVCPPDSPLNPVP